MVIYKTTDYFNITAEEAARNIDDYNTKEEAIVLDSGLEHYFFETYERLENDFNSKECKDYVKKYGYEIIIFQFVADNSNHNKYCMVLR